MKITKKVFNQRPKIEKEVEDEQTFCFTEILSIVPLEFRNLFDMDNVNQNANLLR